MVHTRDISLITASTTVDAGFDHYIVNVISGTTITLTPITTDGQYLNFTRQDKSTNTVTLQPIAPALFVRGDGATSSTFNLTKNTSISLISRNSNWNLIENNSISEFGSRTYFSTTYVQNNGNLFFTVAGSSTTAFGNISYEGSLTAPISNVSLVLAGTLSQIFNVYLTNIPGTTYGTGSGTLVSGLQIFTFPITTLPTESTVLEFRAQIAGGNNSRLYIYSIRIY